MAASLCSAKFRESHEVNASERNIHSIEHSKPTLWPYSPLPSGGNIIIAKFLCMFWLVLLKFMCQLQRWLENVFSQLKNSLVLLDNDLFSLILLATHISSGRVAWNMQIQEIATIKSSKIQKLPTLAARQCIHQSQRVSDPTNSPCVVDQFLFPFMLYLSLVFKLIDTLICFIFSWLVLFFGKDSLSLVISAIQFYDYQLKVIS